MGRPRLVTITSPLGKRFSIPKAPSYALAFVVGVGNRRRVAHVLHLANSHTAARVWTTGAKNAQALNILNDLCKVLKDDVDVYVVPEGIPLSQVRWGLGCVHVLHAEYLKPKVAAQATA